MLFKICCWLLCYLTCYLTCYFFLYIVVYLKVDEVGKIVPYITSSLPANHMSLKVTNKSINHEIGMIILWFDWLNY